ncbi:30S ribosomal protein S15, partial [Dissostichus eleginoides]
RGRGDYSTGRPENELLPANDRPRMRAGTVPQLEQDNINKQSYLMMMGAERWLQVNKHRK